MMFGGILALVVAEIEYAGDLVAFAEFHIVVRIEDHAHVIGIDHRVFLAVNTVFDANGGTG
jgi:hypothetical protein